MKRLVTGLAFAAGALVLAVGVLATVDLLLTKPSRRRAGPVVPPDQEPLPEPVENAERIRNFSIKRTKSEVGYVYWILEGFGAYKCYELCDSWREAVERARQKLAEVDGVTASAANVTF